MVCSCREFIVIVIISDFVVTVDDYDKFRESAWKWLTAVIGEFVYRITAMRVSRRFNMNAAHP